MVEKNHLAERLWNRSREKKKLAAKRSSISHVSATVWAIVDFPVPAKPPSQKIDGAFGSENQSLILLKTSTRVFSRHRGANSRSAELYIAPSAMSSLSRMQSCANKRARSVGPVSGHIIVNSQSFKTASNASV